MQIFTPGKDGTSIFLFALLLITGTYAYGQTCPEVIDQDTVTDGNQQFFCDSKEPMIGDLLVESGNFAVYETPDATDPIDPNTFLLSGTTYYLGTSTDNCGTAVEVFIYSEPMQLGLEEDPSRKSASKQLGGIGTLVLCVGDVSNPDVYVGDLRTSAPEDEVVWFYSSELNGNRIAIDDPATFALRNNTYFFAARENPYTGCISNMSRIFIELESEPAPTGPSAQTFCVSSNPTLGDIEASGENSYFATATSDVELGPGTPLEDGEDYFITAIGTNCESTERLRVVVSLTEVVLGMDQATELCLQSAQEELASSETARAFFLGMLGPDVPTDGTFEPNISTIVNDFTTGGPGTYTTTYSITDPSGCIGDIGLRLDVTENPDAGEDESLMYCLKDAKAAITSAADLRAVYTSMFDDSTNTGGTFDPSIDALYEDFQANPIGTFTTSYSVTSADCQVSAQLDLFVVEDPSAGDDLSLKFCQEDFEALIADPAAAAADLESQIPNADTGGTFEPSLEEVAEVYAAEAAAGNFPITLNLNYVAGDPEACTDEAAVTIQVDPNADAGEEEVSVIYCSTELPATQTESEIKQIFLDLLTDSAAQDGVFNPSIAEITADYNADPTQTFSTVYTVTNGVCTDEANMSLIVQDTVTAEAGDPVALAFCKTEGPQDLMNFLDADASVEGYFEELPDGIFDPSQFEVGEYTFTYTVDATSTCTTDSDTATYTVEVVDAAAPTIEEDGNVFCDYDDPTITDLEANIFESGEITWYTSATGTETIADTELLEDGVIYYAALQDADNQCESSERLAVTVVLEACELLIPEVFTPNGDGINDLFVIEDLADKYPDFSLIIYNRWGEKVYVGNAGAPYWNGHSTKGSLGDGVLPVGVYFYLIYPNDGETEPFQGSVYLSR